MLESGNSVELPSRGYSISPTLRRGDKIVVKSITSGVLPKPGNAVVYEKNSVFVMHRLMEIIEGNDGNHPFISRGDQGIEQDEPWSQQQLLGNAISYKRGDI